jgi:hypothetical protein
MKCSRLQQILRYSTLAFVAISCISNNFCKVFAQEPAPFDAAALGLEIPTVSPGDGVVLPILANTMTAPPGVAMPEEMVMNSPFDVAMESIFGEANSANWRPLSARTFFSEGWNEPFVFTPLSTSGAPRQGWINSFDGVMYRLWFNAFGYRQNVGKNGNTYYSDWTIFVPLNRRLDIRLDVPYLNTNKCGTNNGYITQFGDMTLTSRFLLQETRDTSVIAVAATSIPTGRPETGGGATQLATGLQFWHAMEDRWVVRGGVNVIVPATNRPDGIRTNGNVNMALGKYITDPGTPWFGDMVIYTSANLITSVDDRGPNNTFFSLTPGYRAEITNNWYHLGGVEVPMVGGPSNYTYGLQFWILKVF